MYCERKEMLMNVSASAKLMAFEVLWCMNEFIEVAREKKHFEGIIL